MSYSLNRRRLLSTCSSGFGMVALSNLMAQQAAAEDATSKPAGKAKSVILCYMSGGVSQVDSFDPKPRLNRDHGKEMPVKVERTQFNNNGKIFGSPFSFRQHGESGIWISDLFPHVASCAWIKSANMS